MAKTKNVKHVLDVVITLTEAAKYKTLKKAVEDVLSEYLREAMGSYYPDDPSPDVVRVYVRSVDQDVK